MKTADVMTPRSELVTVELPGTRDDALEYLQEHGFSSVPVVKETEDGETYRGLVSRDDLIENPDQDQLALLMREVPTTAADTELAVVCRLMVEEGARRVPVVDDDGGLVGILTVTDLVRAVARGEVDAEESCGDLASDEVNTTYVGAPLTVAERELYFARVPYAIVLGDGCEMTGIITEVDIVDVARVVEGEDDTGESIANQDDEWMWEGIKAVGNRYLPTRNVEIPAEPVGTFMTEEVTTISGRRTARDAAQLMIQQDVEQLPLVSGGELAGIVRDINLLEAI